MGRRRRNETEEQRARRELISDFLSAANIQSIASFAFSGIVFLFVNYNAVKLLILLLIPFIEIITLLIASNISNKRLWRK